MYIQLEKNLSHSIQAYTETSITIQNIVHHNSLLLSSQALITDLLPKSLDSIDEIYINHILTLHPELVILGHNNPSIFLPPSLMVDLSQQDIGIEAMQLGPACRTFNILLQEGRHVVLGVIFP